MAKEQQNVSPEQDRFYGKAVRYMNELTEELSLKAHPAEVTFTPIGPMIIWPIQVPIPGEQWYLPLNITLTDKILTVAYAHDLFNSDPGWYDITEIPLKNAIRRVIDETVIDYYSEDIDGGRTKMELDAQINSTGVYI